MVESTATPAPEKVEDLWYPDGNVILTCGDRSFRVHMGILSKQSAIFRDMFAMPQPTGSAPASGDCPVVTLSDDPLYLEHFLRVLYDPLFFGKWIRGKYEFVEIAAAVISLAHKYELDNLYSEAIERLSEDYFTTFDEFRSGLNDQDDYISIEPHAPLISIINVERRIQTPELAALLPFAFYLCCRLKTSLLVDGVVRSDGSVERLSSDDLKRCIDGRMLLFEETGLLMELFIPGHVQVSRCTSRAQCKKCMMFMHTSAHCLGYIVRDDPLFPLDGYIGDFDLCDACVTKLRKVCKEAQSVIWDNLPRTFELDKRVRN